MPPRWKEQPVTGLKQARQDSDGSEGHIECGKLADIRLSCTVEQ